MRAETQNELNNNRGEHILGQRSASEEIQKFIVKSRHLGVDNIVAETSRKSLSQSSHDDTLQRPSRDCISVPWSSSSLLLFIPLFSLTFHLHPFIVHLSDTQSWSEVAGGGWRVFIQGGGLGRGGVRTLSSDREHIWPDV